MKKLAFIVIAVLTFSFHTGYGQSDYSTALGLGVDFGDGLTFVGPSVKHFFAENHVGQADVGFGDDVTSIGLLYLYHDLISGADGLRWYGGAGPAILLFDGGSNFLLRFGAGLDYKIDGVPLAFSFDWRPALSLESNIDDRFEAARFALGFRYAFD